MFYFLKMDLVVAFLKLGKFVALSLNMGGKLLYDLIK